MSHPPAIYASRHLPWRRLAAGLIDGLCIGAWVAIVAAAGVTIYLLSGANGRFNEVQENLLALVVTIAPVTVGITLTESREGASLGKRVVGIRMREVDGGTPTFASLLGRNALKLGVPWTIAHAAVFGLFDSAAKDPPATWVLILLILAYALPVFYVASLFISRGRTPYDRLSNIVVEQSVLTTGHRGSRREGATVDQRRLFPEE
ncbi:RDD family protein [Paenarthrobacter sp. PH39-S1]|uniref:RDD family protein n=1 Tax=Paenarthrobacter sp. PH39-S1 TaxID=3046204 RepID=UPI0024BBD4E4|nr:RDD family protein [Paenarthrobacter sp. PH39-S1]MDJ0356301.1 RDD family protein [Paenarthrobacter sp. PH39-S1]